MNIIVVDDEIASLGTFLYNIVNDYEVNYQMFQLSPLKSVDYVLKNNVDAAFLDINMPEINGVELAKLLIKHNSKIKIIFISGYAQNEKEIAKQLGNNLLGFCYKPYDNETLKKYITDIKATLVQRKLEAVTFGGFDIFYNNELVYFDSFKSKELLALLIDRCGVMVEMGEAIACLWEDKNTELSKRLYRDAVFRLRRTLLKYNVLDIVNIQRARLNVVTTVIDCDMWKYIKSGEGAYSGIYMPSYGWSMETQMMLDDYKEKYKNKI